MKPTCWTFLCKWGAVMISINMSSFRKDERYYGYAQKDRPDPFSLIDMMANPEGMAKEIAENLEMATKHILKASQIIEESGEEVHICIDSLNTQRHERMSIGALASLMSCVIAAYSVEDDNERGYSAGDGSLSLVYRTEYSLLHTLYGLIASVIEHSNYKQQWFDQLRYHPLPVAGSNETEGKFRIAVAVANILNVIGWDRMRDATGEQGGYLDKYGTIDIRELQ